MAKEPEERTDTTPSPGERLEAAVEEAVERVADGVGKSVAADKMAEKYSLKHRYGELIHRLTDALQDDERGGDTEGGA